VIAKLAPKRRADRGSFSVAYVRNAALGRELVAGMQVVANMRRLGGL
jgi:hypothetical protein